MSSYSEMLSKLSEKFVGRPLPLRFGHALCALLVCLTFQPLALSAQTQDNAVNRAAQRNEINRSSIMIATGHPDSTMMKIGSDLSVLINGSDDQGLRVVPVAGDGAQGNIRDLLLLRHIDVALTDLVALKILRNDRTLSEAPWLELAHVATLFPDKIQLITRKKFEDIKQLDGAKISFGHTSSSAALHGKRIFDLLGVGYQARHMALPDAADAILKSEIDALVCFCLTSPGLYKQLAFNLDIHILPIPFNPALQADYLPSEIVHEEFPYFVGMDERIPTVAVTLAMVTYNWKKTNERYARVERFVNTFLNNFSRLQDSPRHEGWKSVQLGAEAPGWTRFPAAQEWLDQRRGQALQDMRVAFNDFLDQWSEPTTQVEQSEPAPQPAAQNDQDQLFEEFLRWRANAQ